MWVSNNVLLNGLAKACIFIGKKQNRKKVDLLFDQSFKILDYPNHTLLLSMENIGGGMAAPSKSAVGPIWLGHRLK